MVSKFYKWQGEGGIVEIEGLSEEAKSANIHDDTLKQPLRHPVTGVIHDSRSSYMKDCARTGTRVVGNDWLGLEACKPEDKITDSLIMDKMRKAESIMRDPAKRRARENENRLRAETANRFMQHGSISVSRKLDER